MARNLRNIWPTLLLCGTLLAVGGVAGFFLRPILEPVVDAAATDDPAADAASQGGGDMVEIRGQTLKNMELGIGKFEVRDYFQQIRIPAVVVERIPQSRKSISAPIAGRITKVFVARGQAVRAGAKLFELRITDQSVTDTQVELLNLFSQMEVSKAKLARLQSINEGVVARTKLLDAEFELNGLKQRRSALIQELGSRGMDDAQIIEFINTKQLAKDFTIFAPKIDSVPTQLTNSTSVIPVSTQTSSNSKKLDNQYFTVETIMAFEGANLELGQSMCELTHHSDLLVKGLAFEKDIETIAAANQKGWSFTAQFGEGPSALVRDDLKLHSVENHVDTKSQTFPIYIAIKNEIINQTADDEDRTFVNWRFKPGQRAHLEVPVKKWTEQIIVPIEAMVREGLETFVFLKISHTHEAADGSLIHEFKKVSVKVLHTDQQFAVLEKSSTLDIFEQYALDQAYQLNLALKQSAGSGGGHSHDH